MMLNIILSPALVGARWFARQDKIMSPCAPPVPALDFASAKFAISEANAEIVHFLSLGYLDFIYMDGGAHTLPRLAE